MKKVAQFTNYFKTLSKSALVLGLMAAANLAQAAPPPNLRVLMSEGETHYLLSAASAINFESDGQDHQRLKKTVSVSCNDQELMVNGETFPVDSLTFSNQEQQFSWQNKRLHGSVTVQRWNGSKCALINILPLEEYLAGLLNSEISTSWPAETLKAQAIAARTYALEASEKAQQQNKPYDLRATVMDQVYNGAHVNDARGQDAVAATRGMILKTNGKLQPVFYHSCCGGQTEYPHNAWNRNDRSAVVLDRFCERAPKVTWELRLPLQQFVSTLQSNGIEVASISDVSTLQNIDSPRVDQVMLNDGNKLTMVKATDLRKYLGYSDLKSTWFNVGLEKNQIVFAGRGYGHGVGMCQWGAKKMAEEGHTFEQILTFYYPTSQVGQSY